MWMFAIINRPNSRYNGNTNETPVISVNYVYLITFHVWDFAILQRVLKDICSVPVLLIKKYPKHPS